MPPENIRKIYGCLMFSGGYRKGILTRNELNCVGLDKTLYEFFIYLCPIFQLIEFFTKAVIRRCFVKKVFLIISENSQENTCARVSFLIKLHTSVYLSFRFECQKLALIHFLPKKIFLLTVKHLLTVDI